MNITSTIKPEKTIMEIESILLKFGAKGIIKEYEGNNLDSITFYIKKGEQNIAFKLPMKLEKMRMIIINAVDERKLPSKFRNEPHRSEKAQIVGWRIIKDWIKSQLSIYEIDFADPIELLLPYVYNIKEKQTFYEKLKTNPNLLLEYNK